jgi:hypothetical protein
MAAVNQASRLAAKACDYLAQYQIDGNYSQGLSDEDVPGLRAAWEGLESGELAVERTSYIRMLETLAGKVRETVCDGKPNDFRAMLAALHRGAKL